MGNRHFLRRRKTRLWWCAIVALCLLLNQWAVAAYVCPQHFENAAGMALPHCHRQADSKQPGLCHEHCNPADLTASAGKLPNVPPGMVPPLAPALRHGSGISVDRNLRVARDCLPAPPLLHEQLCRLLI